MFLLAFLVCNLQGALADVQLRGSKNSTNMTTAEMPRLFQENETQMVDFLAKKAASTTGPVHCLCKDRHEKYYCAESYKGFTKCYPSCDSACSRTGGQKFMCGGAHEVIWLDRYFKQEEGKSMTCKLDKSAKGKK